MPIVESPNGDLYYKKRGSKTLNHLVKSQRADKNNWAGWVGVGAGVIYLPKKFIGKKIKIKIEICD